MVEDTTRSRFNWSKFQITIALVVAILASAIISSAFTYTYQQRVEHRICVNQAKTNKSLNQGFGGVHDFIVVVRSVSEQRLIHQKGAEAASTRKSIDLYNGLISQLNTVKIPKCD